MLEEYLGDNTYSTEAANWEGVLQIKKLPPNLWTKVTATFWGHLCTSHILAVWELCFLTSDYMQVKQKAIERQISK